MEARHDPPAARAFVFGDSKQHGRFDIWQRKDMFRQRIKIGFGQGLAAQVVMDSTAAPRDEGGARGAFSVLTVADVVVQSLELVLFWAAIYAAVCVPWFNWSMVLFM